MTFELQDLIGAIAVQAAAVADSVLSSLFALYSAGAPGGLDVGPLLAGGAAGGAGGAAAAAGGGGGGSNVGRNDLTSLPTTRGHDTDERLHEQGVSHEHFGEGGTVSRENWRGNPGGRMLDVSRQLQKWADNLAGHNTPEGIARQDRYSGSGGAPHH